MSEKMVSVQIYGQVTTIEFEYGLKTPHKYFPPRVLGYNFPFRLANTAFPCLHCSCRTIGLVPLATALSILTCCTEDTGENCHESVGRPLLCGHPMSGAKSQFIRCHIGSWRVSGAHVISVENCLKFL